MTFINNYKLLIFDELDSTSSEAIRVAKRDKPDSNYVILAKSQTKARGRSGKSWQSTSGNLHTSLLIKPNKDLELLPQLSFVSALAVYDTLCHSRFSVCHSSNRGNPVTFNVIPQLDCGISGHNPQYKILRSSRGMTSAPPPPQIQLKWPNDVLVNSRKISGILLESVKVEEDYYLIIGIGINITYHPDNIDQPTTSLFNENLPTIEPQALLEILINNFEKYYQIWEKEGFSFIREAWLKHAYKLHENITVKHQNNLITGIFKDIDPTGRIILQLPSKKIISFSTAELPF